jgi:hypothetical protein
MANIPYAEMKRVVLKFHDADTIAAHFNCERRAAMNMILLVESETGKSLTRSAQPETPVITKPKLQKFDPRNEKLDWSYEKEKQMMAQGSYQLICAMLRAGQHRLTPEMADKMKQQVGLQFRFDV